MSAVHPSQAHQPMRALFNALPHRPSPVRCAIAMARARRLAAGLTDPRVFWGLGGRLAADDELSAALVITAAGSWHLGRDVVFYYLHHHPGRRAAVEALLAAYGRPVPQSPTPRPSPWEWF